SIDRGDDRRIEIRAPGASDATPYVQSLKVNGRSTSRPWLSLRDAPAVTRLDFALGASPNPAWRAAAADAPPSYPAGPVRFPPSTPARLSLDPARVRLQAGAGAAVSIVVDDTAGTAPATVTWSAQVPAGLTLTPAAATVTAPAGQLVATAATLSAAAGARPGFSNVTFAARDGDGAVLRRETLAVTIASNGAVVPTAYVANFTDGSLTPIDVETNVAGPPIAIGAGPNDVIISPDGRRAYTANQNSNNVSVIDTVANSVDATVDAGNH